ncbi:unnamed protein product [Paramecium sonneborni]|uniref:Uncharacterized protein n=1 Tax=Paramecium sonneborni TaxID=65129 RepID=A0A8S1NDR4_9CILI|nr:unnamed protein product [Paramecium sonneborni]
MEIMPVETKKRIHEFSYAQKVSNQISPDKSQIKLNETLFKAKILEKQSCTLIKDIQKDLLMKIKKYDSMLKKNSTFKNISNSQPTSPPLKNNQEKNLEVTLQKNQIKHIGEKMLTEFVHQKSPNHFHRESLPVYKLEEKLLNFTKEKDLFSSQDISPIKQEQNINEICIRRNNTQNATPKQKKSTVKEFFASQAKLHVSKSTSANKNNLFESNNQVQSSKEAQQIKKNDIKRVQSSNKKSHEITDYTIKPKHKDAENNIKNRIKKDTKQRQSIDLSVNTDLKDIIHIINDLDLCSNRFKKKQ